MSHFESNIKILSTRQPDLAGLLRQSTCGKVRVFPSACGSPTATWEHAGSSLALHSRYDPLREAGQRLKSQDYAGKDYFILLGFGLGYLLDALVKDCPSEFNHYFIVESDLEIIRAAFEARDLSEILSLPQIHFAWPPSGPALAEQWQKFFDPVQAQQSTYLTHLPSVSLRPDLFKSAAEIIQSQTFQIFTDINTLVVKSQAFLDNFAQNLPKAVNAPGVINFSTKFTGRPAVIVSAGPSLDKNIHELRGYEDRILIISTDTALKPLLSAGIEPHFVLTGDPSYANYLHLKGAASGQSLLVAEATCYPDSFGEFENRTITCTFENSSLCSLSDLLGNKGTLRAWGSVATMALDFALLLRCDPIVFIGQDLAHTDGRIYCSGVYFDAEWFSEITDPDAWEKKIASLRASRRTVTVEDIHRNPIESTDKLTSYWNWITKELRNHPNVRFINATEGGILKDNVEIASLKEVLYRHCVKDLDLRKQVQSIFENSKAASLFYHGVNISVLSDEMLSLQGIVRSGLQLCNDRNVCPINQLPAKLESIKNSIYRNSHLAPLMDCLNQMGNIGFLRTQRSFSRQDKGEPPIAEIKSCYSSYFHSVQEALSKIERALWQIEANLNE